MKLKIEHLAPYLPYGLKLNIQTRRNGEHQGTYIMSAENIYDVISSVNKKVENKSYYPILRNLSDLTKEIEVNGEKFVPMVELAKIANLDITKYSLGEYNGDTYGILCDIKNDDDIDTHEVLGFDLISGFGHHYKPSKNFTIVNNQLQLWNKLFEWHFDIFGLIQNNLAIDLNSLNK